MLVTSSSVSSVLDTKHDDVYTRKQRVIIRFLHLRGMKPIEIHQQLSETCNDGVMDMKNVRSWVRQFKEGRMSCENKPKEPTTCTIFQVYFDKELYMFRTGLLSIIRSLNAVFTATGICHSGYVAVGR